MKATKTLIKKIQATLAAEDKKEELEFLLEDCETERQTEKMEERIEKAEDRASEASSRVWDILGDIAAGSEADKLVTKILIDLGENAERAAIFGDYA